MAGAIDKEVVLEIFSKDEKEAKKGVARFMKMEDEDKFLEIDQN